MPRSDCRLPIAAGRASLRLRDNPGSEKDSALWKWLAGDTTSKADFGAPLTTTDYRVCVYVGSDLRADASINAADLCDGRPCWKAQTRGYQYRRKTSSPVDQMRVTLREGLTPGKAKIQVTTRGAALAVPALDVIASPVTIQLDASNGLCWQAVYRPPFERRDAVQLQDHAD
jgi:hypothetical protein